MVVPEQLVCAVDEMNVQLQNPGNRLPEFPRRSRSYFRTRGQATAFGAKRPSAEAKAGQRKRSKKSDEGRTRHVDPASPRIAGRRSAPPARPMAMVNMPRLVSETAIGKAASARIDALRQEKGKGDHRQTRRDSGPHAEFSRPRDRTGAARARTAGTEAEAELGTLNAQLQGEFTRAVSPILKKILEEDHLGVIIEYQSVRDLRRPLRGHHRKGDSTPRRRRQAEERAVTRRAPDV